MLRSYGPLLILLLVSIVNAVAIVGATALIGPNVQTRIKGMAYESGMDPLGSTRERFTVRFYLIAILFIVFDVETVFLLPWAVSMRALGWPGFWTAMVFIFILTIGLIYEWKKGALEWE